MKHPRTQQSVAMVVPKPPGTVEVQLTMNPSGTAGGADRDNPPSSQHPPPTQSVDIRLTAGRTSLGIAQVAASPTAGKSTTKKKVRTKFSEISRCGGADNKFRFDQRSLAHCVPN